MTERTAAAPTLVSLLICDQVIDDRLTNKKSAIGLFNTITTHSIPARLPQVTIMATLTEVRGRTPLELRLVRDSDNEVVMQTSGYVDSPDPLAIVDLVFGLQGIKLPEAGQYAFELLSGGALLGRRRFQLLLTGPDAARPKAE